jgi:hypothetical protein
MKRLSGGTWPAYEDSKKLKTNEVYPDILMLGLISSLRLQVMQQINSKSAYCSYNLRARLSTDLDNSGKFNAKSKSEP